MIIDYLSSVMAKRQIASLKEILSLPAAFARFIAEGGIKRAFSLFLTFFQLIGAMLFDAPVTPYKDSIDISRFDLVWSDEFDNGFNSEIWQGHYVYGENDTQLRDVAYWNRQQVSFTDDGYLQITVDYKENGPAGPGYYSYGMETNPNKNYSGDHKGYEQLYGYFEIRCKMPKGKGINPAFWLLTDGMWDDDTDGGLTGAEVDVFETTTNLTEKDKKYNSVYQTIHVDGYESSHKQEIQGYFYGNDIYNEFNIYGVEWNENEYIFYINGVETARTSFEGVCRVPLYLIISVGVDENIKENMNIPAVMTVDYVRCYQYKSNMVQKQS